MPTAALRPCSVCRQLGCTAHHRPAWGHASTVKRITGTRLPRLRWELLDKQTLCVLCLGNGRTTVATNKYHIVNLQLTGQDDQPSNDGCQGICQACHDEKTQRESVRGRGAWR